LLEKAKITGVPVKRPDAAVSRPVKAATHKTQGQHSRVAWACGFGLKDNLEGKNRLLKQGL
jgi:hypothetical protein